MNIIDKVLREALIEVFPTTSVNQVLGNLDDNATVRDLRRALDFDSLDEIEFIMALEEGLGVEISDRQAEDLLDENSTMGQLKRALQDKISNR